MTRLQGALSETAALVVSVGDGLGKEEFDAVRDVVGRISQATQTAGTKNRIAKNVFIVRF